jgi:hypothetical protein
MTDYAEYLAGKVDLTAIGRALGLNKKQLQFFKHAGYYMNMLIDGKAEVGNIEQIFAGLGRIDAEEIPNVPVVAHGLRELPIEVLRANAVVLLKKAAIEGLDQEQFDLLIDMLKILLPASMIRPAEIVVNLIHLMPKQYNFPISVEVLRKYLCLNKKRHSMPC